MVTEWFLYFCRVESMNLLLQLLITEGNLQRGTTQLMPDTPMVGGYDLMMRLSLLLEQIRCYMIKPMSFSTDSCEHIPVVKYLLPSCTWNKHYSLVSWLMSCMERMWVIIY